jgi:hypothetical protein
MMNGRGSLAGSFRSLGIITVAFEAILLGTSSYYFLARLVPDLVFFSHLVATCALTCLLFIHLLVGSFGLGRSRRLHHVVVGTTAFLVCVLSLWSLKWHAQSNYTWFVQKDMEAYGRLVKLAQDERRSLTEQPRFLSTSGAGTGASLWACTNKDGSLMVWVKPAENDARLGYFYTDSRSILKNCPWDEGHRHFYHITNGWYEF